MPASAWKQLLAGWPWFRGDGRYPLAPADQTRVVDFIAGKTK